MKSNVQAYDAEFDQLYKVVCAEEEAEARAAFLHGYASACRLRQHQVDPSQPSIIAAAMAMSLAKKTEDEAWRSFRETKKLFNEIQAEKPSLSWVLKEIKNVLPLQGSVETTADQPLDVSKKPDIEAAKKAQSLNVLLKINAALAAVFRFEFLSSKVHSKALRIAIACIVWLVIGSAFSIMPWVLLCACANAAVLFALRSAAKKELLNHRAIWLAITDPKAFMANYFKAKMDLFRKETGTAWKEEVELAKARAEKGEELQGEGELYRSVKANLEKSFRECEHQADEYSRKSAKQVSVARAEGAKAKELADAIAGLEPEVRSMILDPEHNEGVLSPFVAAGFSRTSVHGVSPLVVIEHRCKPVFISYERETARDGERFRKNVARMVELLMNSFLQENSYEVVDLWLVDLETGGALFPESRTKGFMKVVRTQQDLRKLYDHLRESREVASRLENGRIESINPKRFANREKPLKYNVVFFFGADCGGMAKEDSQLFVGGSTFGFLPIVFMGEEEMEKAQEEKGGTKPFAAVIGKAKDNDLVFSFEKMVDQFEFGLAVSDNPDGVFGQKVISYEEFMRDFCGDEGIDVPGDGSVCFDVVGLTSSTYDLLESQSKKSWCFVSSQGETPEFLKDREVIDLSK